MKEGEKEKLKVGKEKEVFEGGHSSLGRLLLAARQSRACLVYAYVLMVLVLAAVPFLASVFTPVALEATSQLKALKPDMISGLISKLALLIEALAVYATLSFHWQAHFSGGEVYEGGLRQTRGWLVRRELTVASDRIRGIWRKQSWLGRRLGFGDVGIEYGSGEGPLLFEGIENPAEFEAKVARLFRRHEAVG